MIRGFFDEMLVAERQFDVDPHELAPGFTPGGNIDNKAYRQLRFAKLDLASASVTSPQHVASLDVVRTSDTHDVCGIFSPLLICSWRPVNGQRVAIFYFFALLLQRPKNKPLSNVSFQMEEEALKEITDEEHTEAEVASNAETWTTVFQACGVPL
eukprot:INCI16683.2.p1 GENE.INCI16683.2~~INCI16683.2.p1  ORF type:complete len:155 (-),score=33.89 INCI16683.2:144-608(-)